MRVKLDKIAFRRGKGDILRLHPGKQIRVYEHGTGTLADGYTTEVGATLVTYPLIADRNGQFNAWYTPRPLDLDFGAGPRIPWQPWGQTVDMDLLDAEIPADWEHAYTMRKLVADFGGYVTGAVNYTSSTVWGLTGANVTGGPLFSHIFHLDPADHEAGDRDVKLLLRVNWGVNAVAPAQSFSFGLWPLPAGGGGINNVPFPTLVAANKISGSNVTVTTPAANARSRSDSGVFDFPAADEYAIGFTGTGTTATNSSVGFRARLFVCQQT